MAFREITYRDETAASAVLELHSWQRADRPWFDISWSRRPIGVAGAFAFHVILAAILLHITAKSDIDLVKDTSSGLKLFDVPANDASASADQPDTRQEAGAAANTALQEPTESQPPAPAPEWSVSQMRVARAPSVPTNTNTSSSAASAPLRLTTPSSAGSSGFDPYAGASPRRPGETYGSAALPGATPASGVLTMNAKDSRFAALRTLVEKALRARFPQLKGTFALTLKIKDGEVSDVTEPSGRIDRATLSWLKSSLRRQAAVIPQTDTGASSIEVPSIVLS